jgi:hypothetical protein
LTQTNDAIPRNNFAEKWQDHPQGLLRNGVCSSYYWFGFPQLSHCTILTKPGYKTEIFRKMKSKRIKKAGKSRL